MATLGDLERSVMNLLWDSPVAKTASDIRDGLAAQSSAGISRRELAVTTVLTVLTRLEAKGFVSRDRDIRPHLFEATTTRANHMAELMHEVLGTAPDREAVLARFVGQVSPSEVASLRRLLDGV
jgi:predicted transcriptional regulator